MPGLPELRRAVLLAPASPRVQRKTLRSLE